MSKRTLDLNDALYDYLLEVGVREPELLRELRAETAPLKSAGMQISPEQGRLLDLLLRLTGARRALEIGVYTGYSSLCIAGALPADGLLVACDVSEKWTAVARRYWERAGLADRVELRLQPALDTLNELRAAGGEPFDFAFIDADKTNYKNYYEACLALLRPGGLVAVDNVLWGGRVIDAEADDEDTRAIRAFNEFARGDQRVEQALVPIGDGLTLLRKK